MALARVIGLICLFAVTQAVLATNDATATEGAQSRQRMQQLAAVKYPMPPSPFPKPSDPSVNKQAPAQYHAVLYTSEGTVVIKCIRAWAPKGADRFYNLIKAGFYDGATFFRVVPKFVVQFGLSGDPKVNAVWTNANIKDDKVTQKNKKGSLTFATAGPDTRSTQLFINLADNFFLDKQGFSPFGFVTMGMDNVEKITSKYGEKPDQGKLTSEGEAYIKANFPDIDYIKRTTASVSTSANQHTA